MMMQSPECYYDENLKGKKIDHINAEIHKLKIEIDKAKKYIQSKGFIDDFWISITSNPELWLYLNECYLKKAKETLIEIGGVYTPSDKELKAQHFEENIPYINIIELYISWGECGYQSMIVLIDEYEIDILKDIKKYVVKGFGEIYTTYSENINFNIRTKITQAKKVFFENMKNLCIGDWDSHYDDEEHGLHMVCDGTEWDLKIYFSNDCETIQISGDNIYPHNYDEFIELFDNLGSTYADNNDM